ncbi:hypothetical protein Rsub_10652 [Raphidocelis subcapitata]|uniref:Uncharacterized protein n=1 Tax=Raphidocelis subcapitata TaxID=307507 RepID=A0A2V0PDP9_9CHLO|nr:hypothetical protein Rsub_10652 [Raphidocelis subcapitata]|eukprot:GBF97978.1 hypothetical protein Rsub_10652 [Raphidocelis subcapitata]
MQRGAVRPVLRAARGAAAPCPALRRRRCRGPPPARAAPESIRDFIAREAPLRSLDGSFRERPLEPSLQAPFLVAATLPPAEAAGADDEAAAGPLPPCPGAVSLLRLTPGQLEAAVKSGGRVVLLVAAEGAEEDDDDDGSGNGGGGSGGSGPRIAAPRGRRGGGSYCCTARVAGLLGATARVVAEARAAVQGVDAGAGLAAAAALPDRWAYMVRASAVAEAMAGGAGGQAAPRDVATAASQISDAAADLEACLRGCLRLAGALAEAAGGDGATEAAAREAEAELSTLLEWCTGGGGGGSGGDGGGGEEAAAGAEWARAERLSWAPFAAAALSELADGGAGGAGAQLRGARRGAMEATDLGERLEDALSLAGRARAALSARLALLR